MKRISVWAYHHKWPARIIIVILHFILIITGLFFGTEMYDSKIYVSPLVVYFLAFLFITAFITYPSKKEKARYKNFYKTQKTSDLFLIVLSFLLIICFGNHYNLPNNQSAFSFSNVSASEIAVLKDKRNSETTSSITPSPKKKMSLIDKWRKKLKENIKTLKKEYKTATSGEKAALIVLAVLVALLAFFGIMSLSCNLSCSGNDGAALIVGILGTGLIIFLLVRVIKRIHRRPTKPKPEAKTVTG